MVISRSVLCKGQNNQKKEAAQHNESLSHTIQKKSRVAPEQSHKTQKKSRVAPEQKTPKQKEGRATGARRWGATKHNPQAGAVAVAVAGEFIWGQPRPRPHFGRASIFVQS